MKIMIVDDHSGMREMLRSLVSALGFDVAECSDGTAAVLTYEQYRPDLVLMDIVMGAVDGLSATRQIRQAHPEARVVIVSEHQGTRMQKAAEDAGACAFLPKDRLLELPGIVAMFGTRPIGMGMPGLEARRGEL